MIMSSKNLLENVEKALEEIRPFLQNDGGNINLIGIENETVVKVPYWRMLHLYRQSNDLKVWSRNDHKKICATDSIRNQY